MMSKRASKHIITICILTIIWFVVLNTNYAYAETDTQNPAYNFLYVELEKQLDQVYQPYSELSTKIGNASTFSDDLKLELYNSVVSWRDVFVGSILVFNKYNNYSDTKISEIATKALDGSEKGLQSCDSYISAYKASDGTSSNYYLTQGDTLMKESVTLHDEAVDLYNNYSGVASAYNLRDTLIGASIISALFSLFLFFKSRRKSVFSAELTRSQVFTNLFSNSMWMSVGLIITTAGYAYTLKNGGTYYILWGPVLIGGLKLLQGLFGYFTKGRQLINAAAVFEKIDALKSSYIEPEIVNSEGIAKTLHKRCKTCHVEVSTNAIVCPKCGNNML